MKVQKRDQKTEELILNREIQQDVEDEKENKLHQKKREEEVKAARKKQEEGVAKGIRRSTRKGTRGAQLEARRKEQYHLDQLVDEEREAKDPVREAKRKRKIAKVEVRNPSVMMIQELQVYAKELGLKTTGNRRKLVSRIQKHLRKK